MNLVIPLAGEGSRFVEKGIKTPKYLIHVGSKKIIDLVLDTIETSEYEQIIFLINENHELSYGVSRFLQGLCHNCEVVVIPEITEGTTCTVLWAEKVIRDQSLPLVIHTSDIWFTPRLKVSELFADGTDGTTLTFKANSPSYSYALDDGKMVTRTEEKRRISRWANIGVYAFKSFEMFKEYANDAISNKEKTKNEYYIAPLFNKMLADKKAVSFIRREYVHVVGTPDEHGFYVDHVMRTQKLKVIGVVCDHSGFAGKNLVLDFLKSHDSMSGIDLGCYSPEPCDYPDFVIPAVKELQSKRIDFLIAICHSGQGVNIALNKQQGVISCLVYDIESLSLALRHNCPNALSISDRSINYEQIDSFFEMLTSEMFEGGRHSARLWKLLNS